MKITEKSFTRVNNDTNGNPRYVIHFLELSTKTDQIESEKAGKKGIVKGEYTHYSPVKSLYDLAVKRAKKLGGKKYRAKSYGGGIVFQSYNLRELAKRLNELKKSH